MERFPVSMAVLLSVLIFLSLLISGCQTISSTPAGANDCPQVNLSLRNARSSAPSVYGNEYAGWKIIADSFQYVLDAEPNQGQQIVYCDKGNLEGQYPNYWYCGGNKLLGSKSYLQKTFMNNDGTIGKTVKKTFINIYDEKQNFLKTICGDNINI